MDDRAYPLDEIAAVRKVSRALAAEIPMLRRIDGGPGKRAVEIAQKIVDALGIGLEQGVDK